MEDGKKVFLSFCKSSLVTTSSASDFFKRLSRDEQRPVHGSVASLFLPPLSSCLDDLQKVNEWTEPYVAYFKRKSPVPLPEAGLRVTSPMGPSSERVKD